MVTCLTKSQSSKRPESSNQAVILVFTLDETKEDLFTIINTYYIQTKIDYNQVQVGQMAVLNNTNDDEADIILLMSKSS